jgi:hypothetical protein
MHYNLQTFSRPRYDSLSVLWRSESEALRPDPVVVATPMSEWFSKVMLPRGDWTVSIALGLILLSHVTLPSVRNINFRDTANTSWNLVRTLRGIPTAGRTVARGDDQGPNLLMAATIALAYSRQDLTNFTAIPHIPRLYFVLLVGLNAFMLGVLYFAARSLWGPGVALGLIAVLTLGSNVRFLAFAFDVYLFPWYAGILMLAAFALFESTAWSARLALGACVFGIALCTLFRNGSSWVGVGFLFAAVRPQWITDVRRLHNVRLRAVVCGAGLVLLCAAKAVWLPQSHVLWHSLHSGLLEFGGHRDAGGHIYPYFVSPAKLPPGAEFVPRWSDNMAFDLVSRTRPGVVVYSAEYEEIVRQDVLRVLTNYPLGITRLLGRRLWRVLILNPWQARGPDSLLISEWFDTPLRIAWLTLVAAGFYRGVGTRTLLSIMALTPLLLPALLVHSGYLMYNFPGHLVFYLLLACSVRAVLGTGDVSQSVRRPAHSV